MTQPAQLVAAIKLPVSVTEFAEQCARLEREHGDGLVLRQHHSWFLVATPGTGDPLGCWCHTCDDVRRQLIADAAGDSWVMLPQVMVVCPDCGNKRCPKANHHDHQCTGSNEPGQPGSAYPDHTERTKSWL